MGLMRSVFGAGSGTNPSHTERVEQVSEERSRSRGAAGAVRQGRSIGGRSQQTVVGSPQARAAGTNRTRGTAPTR